MKSNQVPLKFKVLFWDCNFTELNTQRFSRFIISRILEKGNRDSLMWLFKQYTYQEIKNAFETSQQISNRTRSFWKLYDQQIKTA